MGRREREREKEPEIEFLWSRDRIPGKVSNFSFYMHLFTKDFIKIFKLAYSLFF